MPRIAEIDIENILGTKRASFKPGTLTVISGRNGEGKSSLLEAIKRCFQGGHDPNLLRRGAKLGHVSLTLDTGAKIKVSVSQRGTTYEAFDENGEEVKAPRSYIEQLGDSLAVDPARLLLAKPKDLAAILLETMPIKFSQAELQEVVDENTWAIARDMSLEEIEVLRKQIYDARTTANRQAKDAEATVKSLRSGLSESDDTDWAARAKELRDLESEGKQSREAAIALIDREERDAIDAIRAKAQRDIDEAKGRAANKRRDADAEWNPQIAKIREAASVAEDRMRDRDRAEGVRRSIAEFQTKADNAQRESDHFSSAIAGLEELKHNKLASLPIRGLEVRDGQVFVDGTAFEHINLAERIKIAFSIAALRSGQLPFMVLDSAEAMDPQTWEAFKEGAVASGFQVIAAKVSDTPLSVEVAA